MGNTPHGNSETEATVSVISDHADLALSESTVAELVLRTILLFPHPEGAIGEVGIVLSNRNAVHALNRKYLDHDYPTDVLSFQLTATPPFSGEIYVDLDMAAERCAEFGSSFELEAYRYIVHGVLHLLGMDDANPAGRDTMHHAENEVLATFKGDS